MKYYLFKQGALTGPVSAEKLEEMKLSNKLYEYHWLIDSETQTWKSITEAPGTNPFKISQQKMKDRLLSGAFFIAKNAFAGEIRSFHTFGVELVIKDQKTPLRGLSELQLINLNLCDETNFTFINTKAFMESQEVAEDGLHVRFHWDQKEVAL